MQIGGDRLTREAGPLVAQLLNTWPVFTEITKEMTTQYIYSKKRGAVRLPHQMKTKHQGVQMQTGGEC